MTSGCWCCRLQALIVLHMWVEKNREHATGNELERALKRIDRTDIITSCMHSVEEVTDENEKRHALIVCREPDQDKPKLQDDGKFMSFAVKLRTKFLSFIGVLEVI